AADDPRGWCADALVDLLGSELRTRGITPIAARTVAQTAADLGGAEPRERTRQLKARLGADLVVTASCGLEREALAAAVRLEDGGARRLLEARETAPAAELAAMAARLGHRLRRALRAPDPGRAAPELSSLPRNPEAIERYFVGLRALGAGELGPA